MAQQTIVNASMLSALPEKRIADVVRHEALACPTMDPASMLALASQLRTACLFIDLVQGFLPQHRDSESPCHLP